jgi:hypothetical protein
MCVITLIAAGYVSYLLIAPLYSKKDQYIDRAELSWESKPSAPSSESESLFNIKLSSTQKLMLKAIDDPEARAQVAIQFKLQNQAEAKESGQTH